MASRVEIGISKCLSSQEIMNDYKGEIVENQDGTVSVFIQDVDTIKPLVLSKICCEYINPNYTFDIENQKCRWSSAASCNLQDSFKIVLNPKGNDGTLFYTESDDNCFLSVDFDYLFKLKCETLGSLLGAKIAQRKVNPNESIISDLQSKISLKTQEYESYTNQLDEYSKDLSKVLHSIVCNSIPTASVIDGSVKIKTIGNSAFGTTAPFGFGSTLIAGQTYCLTEPEGLIQWKEILGEIRYNNFINGDQSSYSCSDVQTIFDKNTIIINNNMFNGTNNSSLIVECDTPINTKSNLLKKINYLANQQSKSDIAIRDLEGQLAPYGPIGNFVPPRANVGVSLSPFEPIGLDIPELSCNTPLDFFENFDVSMSIDVVTSANTLNTVYSGAVLSTIGAGNLYSYLVSHPNSGFYVCGDPTGSETQPNCTPLILELTGGTSTNVFTCESVVDNLVNGLYDEYSITGTSISDFQESLSPNAFASQWLHYHTIITDPSIIALIANQKIKISLNINHTCGDFCVLIDNIELDKICTSVKENNIFLTKSPGFTLNRVGDNKKSWLANSTTTNRIFNLSNNLGNNTIRQTNYNVNDERLVINSKEIDLDISIASAIETDVWCYLQDNNCLLTGITTCNPCIDCGNKSFMDDDCFFFMDGEVYEFMDGLLSGSVTDFSCCGDNQIDFTKLLSEPLSGITTSEDFNNYLTSELIDVKNRQTISGYPTLRALYDRYTNSSMYCSNNSSGFNYLTMDQFAGLVGNYWIDIVEQVIPATTIWGSVKIYSNTIFDQQKYKYRTYTSLLCGESFSGITLPSPINRSYGECENVDVTITTIKQKVGTNLRLLPPQAQYCNSICIGQLNHGSEFVGKVTIIGPPSVENLPYYDNGIYAN